MSMLDPDRKYKDDDVAVDTPFDGLEKGAVLQECRIFNDRQLDTRRCEEVLVRLLYLVGQGDVLSSEEATIVFFSVTKLFQANEPVLRRLVYLAIKELAHSAEEVIIVTNCLTKDINSEVDMYRANATRVLCTITDAQIIQQVERYLKQEIVDRNPVVASSALVSGQQLIAHGKGECVRRWVNEITQALDHGSPMVQYHALALLYLIKQHDRLAVSKLVQSMTRQGVTSPMALVLLIRYVTRIMAEEAPPSDSSSAPRPFFDFLEACLRHRADIVSYEAARAIANLPGVTPVELQPAVGVLLRMLVVARPAPRFAAIRTLNKIASKHPLAVSSCNADMEVLIADRNKSVATLAITTLLRTGSESSVERLLRQIQGFLSDIADEFKIKVVEAIHALCLKYPYKYDALMNFLGDSLKDEGGFAYKKAIVEAFLGLVEKIPESKETCLAHLCEFIEDCEHSQLSTQILHLLGKEGPLMPKPGNYIRYIYNRLILENATVRAAAVAALSRFAGANSTAALRRSVAILLRQSLMDSDDEVRDRATFYMASLGLNKLKDIDDAGSVVTEDEAEVAEMVTATDKLLDLPCPIANLEAELLHYVTSGSKEVAFDINKVSKAAIAGVSPSSPSALGGGGDDMGVPSAARSQKKVVTDLAEEVMKVEQFQSLGRPFRSCPPKDLTEAETEYTASVTVHLYATHVVLEFLCCNTIEDQQCENVYVQVDTTSAAGLGDMTIVPTQVLKYGEPARTYVGIERTADGEYPGGVLGCSLKFVVKDVDTSTGLPDEEGFDEQYNLDDLELGTKHLMAPPAELPSNFKSAWEALGPDNEVVDTFELAQENVPEAVAFVVEHLGMAAFDNTHVVNERASAHVLMMAGVFFPGVQCLLHAKFDHNADGVTAVVRCRSEDAAVSDLVVGSIVAE